MFVCLRHGFHVFHNVPPSVPARPVGPAPTMTPERLKRDCLGTAALWAIRRRANRPHRGEQRLPVPVSP